MTLSDAAIFPHLSREIYPILVLVCCYRFSFNYRLTKSKGSLWVYIRMGEHTRCNFLMFSQQFNSNSTQCNNQFEFQTTNVNKTNYIHRELHTVTPGSMSI